MVRVSIIIRARVRVRVRVRVRIRVGIRVRITVGIRVRVRVKVRVRARTRVGEVDLFPVHNNVMLLGEHLEKNKLCPNEERRRFSCFFHSKTSAESHSAPEGKP